MKLVWVNGTFDIIHPGHLALLNYAKSLGDELIVGLDWDERVSERKGPTRPVNNIHIRMINMKAVDCVNKVVTFATDDELENWIRVLKPVVIVVGSDYIGKKIIGSEWAGEVKYFDRIGGYSTTNIIESQK